VAEPSNLAAAGLRTITPTGPLYRVARPPDPWQWPDWSNVGGDGTFGNRWDDPRGVYRVVYASSSRLGAFMEVLARFRPDPGIVSALMGIEGPDEDPTHSPGELGNEWLANRCLGIAHCEGSFVDVGHSTSLARLRVALASRLVHHGLSDLDAATVRLSAPRRFTQEISRYVYDRSTSTRTRSLVGLAYRSRLGDEFQNWAIFESADGALPVTKPPDILPIEWDDPDLRLALDRLGIRLRMR
jgi:hypothetical protein